MAERTSAKKLTANQLIVRKLKETFNRNALAEDEGVNVWVMVAAAKPFQEGEENELKPELGSQKPSHRVRVVLRTSDAQAGANVCRRFGLFPCGRRATADGRVRLGKRKFR